MNENYATEFLNWNGIKIEVRYCPCWSPAYFKVYGYSLAHLEIKAFEPKCAPLPVTETGYYSHFLLPDDIDEYGSPAAYVRVWLDHEAQSPEWIAQQEAARQGSLF